MDALTKLFHDLFNWLGNLHPGHSNFLLRALFVFLLPTILCRILFARGNRSVAGQTLCFVVAVLAAGTLPVELITDALTTPLVRAWFTAIVFTALLFLPAVLPKVLVPQLGMQRKLQIAGYIVLFGLFIANLWQMRGK